MQYYSKWIRSILGFSNVTHLMTLPFVDEKCIGGETGRVCAVTGLGRVVACEAGGNGVVVRGL